MKIAYIHYHLKTGGVTTVLKQQIKAVIDTYELLVLTGELPETPLPCDTVQIHGLGYGRADQSKTSPQDVAAAVIRAIRSKWKSGCDVLHVHNPLLAKNKNFLKIINILHQSKIKLLLQIHDFAEDGRPQTYFADEPYPADCHYAVINSRDYNLLLKAGLKKQGLHKIANAVEPFDFKATDICDNKLVLYPIRAIRRKNIGEALLLSLFFNTDETLAITLPPNSPEDIKSYAGWKAYALTNGLKVVFDAGLSKKYPELVCSAKSLITTSITEGFGFSFLEPWTAGKMLWGRKLPDICSDFEVHGVQLGHLYTRLNVPLDWIDEHKWFSAWQSCARRASTMFNMNINSSTIEKAYKKTTARDCIDFGLLNEPFQKKVISQVLSHSKYRARLIRLNPFLAAPGAVGDAKTLVQNNKNAVEHNYHQTAYRSTLAETYAKVVKTNVRQRIDKSALISGFFDLENFSLLKWGPYLEE